MAEPVSATEFPFLDFITPHTWQYHEVANILFETEALAAFSGIGPSDCKTEPDMGYSLLAESALEDFSLVLSPSWIPATLPEGKVDVQRICIKIRALLRREQRGIAAGATPREA